MAVARYSARLVRNMLMRRLPAGGKPLQRLSLLRETLSGISISTDHSVDGVVSSKRRGFSERSTLSCTDVSGGQFQKVRWYGPFGWKIVINSQLNEIFGPFPEFGSSFRGSQLLLLSISIEATTCNLRLKLMPTNDPIALVCVMQIKRIV